MYDRRRVRCVRRPGGRVYIPTGWTPPERRGRFNRREKTDTIADRQGGSYIGSSRSNSDAAAPARSGSDRSAGSPGVRFRKRTRQTPSVPGVKAAEKQSGHTRFNLRPGSRSHTNEPASAEYAEKKTPQSTDVSCATAAAPPTAAVPPPPPYEGAAYPYYPPAMPVFYPSYPQPYSVYDQFHSMLTDEELAELAEVEDYEDLYGRDFDRYVN